MSRCGHDCFEFGGGQPPQSELTASAVVGAFDPGDDGDAQLFAGVPAADRCRVPRPRGMGILMLMTASLPRWVFAVGSVPATRRPMTQIGLAQLFPMHATLDAALEDLEG